jgi:hypothetical protein
MDLSNVEMRIGTHDGVDLHDLGSEMPELTRYAPLAAPHGLLVRHVGIIKLLPKPSARAGEHTRGMWAQPLAREQITAPRAVVAHSNGNIDCDPVKSLAERMLDVRVETDLLTVAVQQHGDPAPGESVEA